jgi:hypothetical protein
MTIPSPIKLIRSTDQTTLSKDKDKEHHRVRSDYPKWYIKLLQWIRVLWKQKNNNNTIRGQSDTKREYVACSTKWSSAPPWNGPNQTCRDHCNSEDVLTINLFCIAFWIMSCKNLALSKWSITHNFLEFMFPVPLNKILRKILPM